MFIGTRTECELVQAAMSKSLGYPRMDSVHVGGGIHVEIPKEYSPGAPGWTERYSDIIDDASDKARGSALDLGSFDKLESFTTEKLDSKELADLAAIEAKIEKSEVLPEDWFTKGEVTAP